MEVWHPLRVLLQTHLSTDAQAVANIHVVLGTLNLHVLAPSPHQQKWIARLNALLHSKHAGAVWTGLCLAARTCQISEQLMLEYAQSWIGVALPMLLKDSNAPTVKASVRLLMVIFSAAPEVPEFQRQVATPNIPKFSQTLLHLVGTNQHRDIKVLALRSLARLVPLHPTLHRALQSQMTTVTLRVLDGCPIPTSPELVEAASQLYANLHHTGGKVGATALWRKAIDDTIDFNSAALRSLRSTFARDGHRASLEQVSNVPLELSLDRLKCGVTALCTLLKTANNRVVQLPVGAIIGLSISMLSCTQDDDHSAVDLSLHASELAMVPTIWELARQLIDSIVTYKQLLKPYFTRLVSYTSFHLEQELTSWQRLTFLQIAYSIVTHMPRCQEAVAIGRLARAVLPSATGVLSTRGHALQDDKLPLSTNRKSKKRARGYEGDEIFKAGRSVICANRHEGQVMALAVNVLGRLLDNPHMPLTMQSLVTRVMLSALLRLSHISPARLSADLSLHGAIRRHVHDICLRQASGTSGTMGRELGLIICAGIHHDGALDPGDDPLDLLLHPRLPPLVRPMPHVDSLAFYRMEEGEEEAKLRQHVKLAQPTLSLDAPITSVDPTQTMLTLLTSSVTTVPFSPGMNDDSSTYASPSVPHTEDAANLLSVSSKEAVIGQPTTTVLRQSPPRFAAGGTPSINYDLTHSQWPSALASDSDFVGQPEGLSAERVNVAPTVAHGEFLGSVAAGIDEGDGDEVPSIDMDSDSDS